jgi:hypothetical protein
VKLGYGRFSTAEVDKMKDKDISNDEQGGDEHSEQFDDDQDWASDSERDMIEDIEAEDDWRKDYNDKVLKAIRTKKCPECGGEIIVIQPKTKDVDDIEDWTDEEVDKLDQGWNPIQNFGDIASCIICGWSGQEESYDVSW